MQSRWLGQNEDITTMLSMAWGTCGGMMERTRANATDHHSIVLLLEVGSWIQPKQSSSYHRPTSEQVRILSLFSVTRIAGDVAHAGVGVLIIRCRRV
jgi:hypothetical protein